MGDVRVTLRGEAVSSEKDVCKVCQFVCDAEYGGQGDPFAILNTKTGLWHSGGEWGVTDCGKDVSRDHWRWST